MLVACTRSHANLPVCTYVHSLRANRKFLLSEPRGLCRLIKRWFLRVSELIGGIGPRATNDVMQRKLYFTETGRMPAKLTLIIGTYYSTMKYFIIIPLPNQLYRKLMILTVRVLFGKERIQVHANLVVYYEQ